MRDLDGIHRQIWQKLDTQSISGKLALNTLENLGKAHHEHYYEHPDLHNPFAAMRQLVSNDSPRVII